MVKESHCGGFWSSVGPIVLTFCMNQPLKSKPHFLLIISSCLTSFSSYFLLSSDTFTFCSFFSCHGAAPKPAFSAVKKPHRNEEVQLRVYLALPSHAFFVSTLHPCQDVIAEDAREGLPSSPSDPIVVTSLTLVDLVPRVLLHHVYRKTSSQLSA